MAAMSGYERAMRTFKREPVDTMPFFTGMGMVLLPAIKKLGYKFPQVHTNAEKLAWSGIESARMFNLDSIVIPYDMCWESEALGNKISLYEDSEDILYPTIPTKNWEALDQVIISQEDIQTIMTKGRMPLIPEAIKIVKKEAPEKALGAWQLGPFTQCGQTIELDKVLKGRFQGKAAGRSNPRLVYGHDHRDRQGPPGRRRRFHHLERAGRGGGPAEPPHLQGSHPAALDPDSGCLEVPEGLAYLRVNGSHHRA